MRLLTLLFLVYMTQAARMRRQVIKILEQEKYQKKLALGINIMFHRFIYAEPH